MQKWINCLLAIVLAVVLNPLAMAANTATDHGSMTAYLCGKKTVKKIEAAFDTTGTLLTIYTPAAGSHAVLVGMAFSEGTATNLSLASASTVESTLELAANQGALVGIGTKPLYFTDKGEALQAKVSAATTSILFYVTEGDTWCDNSAW